MKGKGTATDESWSSTHNFSKRAWAKYSNLWKSRRMSALAVGPGAETHDSSGSADIARPYNEQKSMQKKELAKKYKDSLPEVSNDPSACSEVADAQVRNLVATNCPLHAQETAAHDAHGIFQPLYAARAHSQMVPASYSPWRPSSTSKPLEDNTTNPVVEQPGERPKPSPRKSKLQLQEHNIADDRTGLDAEMLQYRSRLQSLQDQIRHQADLLEELSLSRTRRNPPRKTQCIYGQRKNGRPHKKQLTLSEEDLVQMRDDSGYADSNSSLDIQSG